jgi:hypothetical protein
MGLNWGTSVVAHLGSFPRARGTSPTSPECNVPGGVLKGGTEQVGPRVEKSVRCGEALGSSRLAVLRGCQFFEAVSFFR